ncbi:hypothetical protein AJ79_05782 [Helicocarpus griseus UAMH5409]|uniref:CBM21 domain-containing protein n=1 Tax=Helicocarpus griseus UAMH5409 TaxID=1447875 RepID=A0A2B7XJU8_9EURO|nr:hypothetical protein AJ79_05782 [Helicocarpus griseus UAMH5409]
MPYTAPAPLLASSPLKPQLAPAGSSSASRHGRHRSEPSVSFTGRLSIPRAHSSSSYIYRHRRSPTASQYTSNPREERIDSGPRKNGPSSNSPLGAALWKSPSGAYIPTGAVISPPDSKSNSSDDEESTGQQQQILAEIEAAIMSIDKNSLQASSGKSSTIKPAPTSQRVPSPLDLTLALAAEVQDKLQFKDASSMPRPGPCDGASHAQSSEVATHTPEDSDRGEEEMDLRTKPTMVRKKSGELVRPALRPNKRPSSVPGTPTFSKAVHFDSNLEHIRHFLQVDKPLAVSAGSSPVENYDGDSEFPFGLDDKQSSRLKTYEWEVRIANFPDDNEARRTKPVRLERIFLSSDNKNLVGVVSVANISFQKHVVARFTSDYWKTTSEVVAEYNNDVRRKQTNDGYDRFNFNIHLADMGNLETKRMFICIRYDVDGHEFWDNNNMMNYHVDFLKKPRLKSESPTKSGAGPRPTLPRSRPSSLASSRSKSVPPFPGDVGFGSSPSPTADRHGMKETPVKLSSPSKDDDLFDTPIRRNAPAPQTFGNRYDFGASLSAAMQPGSAGQTRRGKPSDRTKIPSDSMPRDHPGSNGDKPARLETFEPTAAASPGASQNRTSSPGPMRPTDIVSGQPYHQSPMYKELVDKYCFYGSSKTGTQSTNHYSRQHRNAFLDGTPVDRNSSVSDSSTSSSQDTFDNPPTPPKIQRSPRPTSPSQSPGLERVSTPSSSAYYTHPFHESMRMTLSESPSPTFIQG